MSLPVPRRSLLRLACLACILTTAASSAGELLSDSFQIDFRNKHFDNLNLAPIDTSSKKLILPSVKGLKMRKAAKVSTPVVGIGTRFGIRGDFQISGTFEVESWKKPKGGYGLGPSLYIVIDDDQQTSALIGRLCRPKEGHVISTSCSTSVDEKRQHNVQLHNTSINKGSLRLSRSGNELTFSVDESNDGYFKELWKTEATDGDIRMVRLGLQQSDVETPAEVTWKDLKIEAEELLNMPSDLSEGEQMHRITYNPVEHPKRIPLFWSFLSAGLLAGVVWFLIWYRRNYM